MAYEEPLLQWSDDRSDEDESGRTYFAAWTIEADSKDDAYEALTSIGVDVGLDESAVYPGVACTRRSVERIGAAALYRGIAEFRREPGDDEDGGDISTRPIYVEYGEGKESQSSLRDAYGFPLLNTARDKLAEPMTEDVDTLFFTIYKWEAEYDARKRVNLSQTMNSDEVHLLDLVFYPGELALRSYAPTGRVQFKSTGEQVPKKVEVAYRFEARRSLLDADGEEIHDADELRTGFYERRLDAGTSGWYFNADGEERKGPIQTKNDATGEFTDVSSPVPLFNGVPLDDTGTYYIAGKDVGDWAPQPPDPASVLYDGSNDNASYILLPKLTLAAYGTILD